MKVTRLPASVPHLSLTRSTFALLALSTVTLMAAPAARADQIVTYNLTNVTLEGGITATGSFDWDFTTGNATACTVQADGVHFYLGGSYPSKISLSTFEGNYDYQQVSYNFAYVLDQSLTPTTGSAITIDPLQSYLIVDAGNPATFAITGGSVQPAGVPEPAAVLPFAASLVALAVKRRRNN